MPGLPDFRLQRVLGQGGFGQVLEVVKRDCGKHYAMKVMHKEMMRRCLGSSWRKKIALEKDLMACLNHPFLVNLAYSFQVRGSVLGSALGSPLGSALGSALGVGVGTGVATAPPAAFLYTMAPPAVFQ